MLLLPFADGQPPGQVNQELIRSILVIVGVKLDTSTRKKIKQKIS